jgi:hypothetical protein
MTNDTNNDAPRVRTRLDDTSQERERLLSPEADAAGERFLDEQIDALRAQRLDGAAWCVEQCGRIAEAGAERCTTCARAFSRVPIHCVSCGDALPADDCDDDECATCTRKRLDADNLAARSLASVTLMLTPRELDVLLDALDQRISWELAREHLATLHVLRSRVEQLALKAGVRS